MHISNQSIASLFQQMQAMASGSSISASFGAQLTGQNLPMIGVSGSSTSSQAPSPLSSTPASQFASNILSELLAAQQSAQPTLTSQQQADPLQAMAGRHHHHGMEADQTTGPASSTSSTVPASSGSAADDEVPTPAASAVV